MLPVFNNYLKCYLVINDNYLQNDQDLEKIEYLLSHGVTICQLRFKNISYCQKIRWGQRIKKLCLQYQIPLIINDDPELCLELNANGVHLGWADMSYQKCRQILGDQKIIGMSIPNLEKYLIAKEYPNVDYFAIGAVYETKSKDNYTIFKDYFMLNDMKVPYVFIGGLNHENQKVLWEKYHPAGMAYISFLLDKKENILLLNHEK